MRCVRDQNGNHVIQKCIECVPTSYVAGMLDAFLGQVVPLSTHPFGCRVIQRILEHCTDQDKYDKVMTEIQMVSMCVKHSTSFAMTVGGVPAAVTVLWSGCDWCCLTCHMLLASFICVSSSHAGCFHVQAAVQLAQDQYGNYVIQHVLEYGKPHERTDLVTKLAPHIVSLSQNKFASNVVEKCLLHGGPDQREIIVHEMLCGTEEGNGDHEPLQQMMKDQFGNYVVQKLLEVSARYSFPVSTVDKVFVPVLKCYVVPVSMGVPYCYDILGMVTFLDMCVVLLSCELQSLM